MSRLVALRLGLFLLSQARFNLCLYFSFQSLSLLFDFQRSSADWVSPAENVKTLGGHIVFFLISWLVLRTEISLDEGSLDGLGAEIRIEASSCCHGSCHLVHHHLYEVSLRHQWYQ